MSVEGPRLPEHPELREIALAMERAEVSGEILDASWRVVFISSESARMTSQDPRETHRFYGRSLVSLQFDESGPYRVTEESSVRWWHLNAPIMRHYLDPADPRFDEVFAPLARAAARIEPPETVPRAWQNAYQFTPDNPIHRSALGELGFLELRINDDSGEFIGVLRIGRPPMPDSLLNRLGRGDRGLFERMQRVSEPARRPSGILFADLEASGALARRLTSRGYFQLISGLTDLIDASAVAHDGITGKHAGDGGSALFVASDFQGSESAAARATIAAAREISAGAAELGPGGVTVNIGLHWGATLMVGQVGTSSRLEVTALGDEMNEAARIESAATDGAILVSKHLLERLEDEDARAVGVDPDALTYTLLGELAGVHPKAVRDAGAIPVTAI